MEALRNMPLPELRQLLAEFPWFASGHIELVRRVAHIDSGVMSELEKAALNVWSRAALYDIARKNSGEMDFTDADAPAAEETVPEPSPRIVVLGGDYFSREDLDSLRPEDRIFSLLGRNGKKEEEETSAEPDNLDKPFDDMRFYTETLAAIYAEQGYFDKAKEVYSKLILLYPEKSAYFASLIEKLKQ